MTYFLDFDRTLFDTSAFLRYVIERDNLEKLLPLSEVQMATELNALATSGALTFVPNELERFLYADAVEFLKSHGASSVIVTAGNPALQRAKLENTFREGVVAKIFYTPDGKGLTVKGLLDTFPGPWVFVDDKPFELASVSAECPDIKAYEMRRDGAPGAGSYPVIRSFVELS